MKTIGLLGGMSWESTELYYRLINEETKRILGGLHSAPIAMVSVDFHDIERLQARDDWDAAAGLLAEKARQIELAGAGLLLICTNTMHKVADQVADAIGIPLLHIADATARHVKAAGARTVGLLGTRFTMEEQFYKARLESGGLTVLVPTEEDRALVHRVIYEELCLGRITSGSRQAFLRIIDDLRERGAEGGEQTVRRKRPADIGVLVVAINRLLVEEGMSLDVRRERAVFRMAATRLAEAEREYRGQQSEQIIRSATRKAVIGALAAISPGTDILIQGYVGTTMTQQLCRLYGAAPRDLDIEEFLSLSQSRVGRALPLTLAVAGNDLKAFPGIGTVAGGFVHAVAYGLIFDALGRSLVQTLSKHGELLPEVAAKEFEEGISEHMEAGVRRIARMALEEKQG